MSGNPKGSPWRSTPAALRNRRGVQVMLSADARAMLEALSLTGGRSALVESLIRAAYAASGSLRPPLQIAGKGVAPNGNP